MSIRELLDWEEKEEGEEGLEEGEEDGVGLGPEGELVLKRRFRRPRLDEEVDRVGVALIALLVLLLVLLVLVLVLG